MTASTMAQQHRAYHRASSLPVEVSMIEEAMKLPVGQDGAGITRCWWGLDSERTSEHDDQADVGSKRDSLAVAFEAAHTRLAAAAADIASPAPPSDQGATCTQDRTRAVNFIVCDTTQFRQLQSQIRSAGAVTDAGTRNVVNALVDERIENMRRIQECRMREIEEERNAMRGLASAEGRVLPGSPNGQGGKPGQGIKGKDLWRAIKSAQTFLVQARSAVEDSAHAADNNNDSSSSSIEDECCCCCDEGDSCTHFDASGWKARGALRRPPREMREFKKSQSSRTSSPDVQQMKPVVRVARGA